MTGVPVSLQSPKFSWGNSNPQFLLVWLYLEIGSLRMYDEIDGVCPAPEWLLSGKGHIERAEGRKTHWAGCLLSRGGNDLDARWWVSCELSEPHLSSALNFKCCTKAGIVEKHFLGQPSREQLPDKSPGASFLCSSIQIAVTNKYWLMMYGTRRGPLTRISHWRRLLTSMPHWMDWLFPTNADHSHSSHILEDPAVLDPQNQTVAIFTWNTHRAQLTVVEKVNTQ